MFSIPGKVQGVFLIFCIFKVHEMAVTVEWSQNHLVTLFFTLADFVFTVQIVWQTSNRDIFRVHLKCSVEQSGAERIIIFLLEKTGLEKCETGVMRFVSSQKLQIYILIYIFQTLKKLCNALIGHAGIIMYPCIIFLKNQEAEIGIGVKVRPNWKF